MSVDFTSRKSLFNSSLSSSFAKYPAKELNNLSFCACITLQACDSVSL